MKPRILHVSSHDITQFSITERKEAFKKEQLTQTTLPNKSKLFFCKRLNLDIGNNERISKRNKYKSTVNRTRGIFKRKFEYKFLNNMKETEKIVQTNYQKFSLGLKK